MKRQPTKVKFEREARAAFGAYWGNVLEWKDSAVRPSWRKVAAAVLREHKRKAR